MLTPEIVQYFFTSLMTSLCDEKGKIPTERSTGMRPVPYQNKDLFHPVGSRFYIMRVRIMYLLKEIGIDDLSQSDEEKLIKFLKNLEILCCPPTNEQHPTRIVEHFVAGDENRKVYLKKKTANNLLFKFYTPFGARKLASKQLPFYPDVIGVVVGYI